MKTTVYFHVTFPHHNLNGAMKGLILERDAWLKENINLIEEIDTESVTITPSHNQIHAILTLSYYPKTNP